MGGGGGLSYSPICFTISPEESNSAVSLGLESGAKCQKNAQLAISIERISDSIGIPAYNVSIWHLAESWTVRLHPGIKMIMKMNITMTIAMNTNMMLKTRMLECQCQ